MRRSNPTSKRSRQSDPLAVVDQDSVTETDAPDDYLVSLRSDDIRRALASIVGCAKLIDSGVMSRLQPVL